VSALERLRVTLPDLALLIESAVEEAVEQAFARRQDDWLTTAEAAKRTGLSARAVRHAAQMGRLESKKVGRRTLVKL
jgi:excisionase family DNA binding protein